jgi:LmbE family N-acetylglucosaminyl deacetylase
LTEFERFLILAPHTDDAELGCGGTIARFLEEKKEIHIVVFSSADASLPKGSPRNMLKEEFFDAMKALGVQKSNVNVYDYPVRTLPDHRQQVLEELVKIRRELEPDMVLLPSGSDLHQDHQVLHSEGLRAFKEVSLWGYELPWNHVSFSAQAFVTLKKQHIDKKWSALSAYKSQFTLKRQYFSKDFIEGLARVRGSQVKAQYAEAFDVTRIKW